jgi:hypothetical protein
VGQYDVADDAVKQLALLVARTQGEHDGLGPGVAP